MESFTRFWRRVALLATPLLLSPTITMAQIRPPTTEPIEAQAVYIIDFADNFADGEPREVIPLPSKANRIKSAAGYIKFDCDTNVPDSIRVAADVAANIWASMLAPLDSVKIKLHYAPIDNDVQTAVSFQGGGASTYYPACYYFSRVKKDTPSEKKVTSSEVTINSTQQWECGFGEITEGPARNVTYAMMRAVANTLGFGASTLVRRGHIDFSVESGYAAFDRMVFNSKGERLSDIPHRSRRDNPPLNAFTQPIDGEEVYVLRSEPGYRLYAPPTYDESASLKLLDNPASLMHYDLNVGDRCFQIDGITKEILDSIGWGLQAQPLVKISAEGIDDSGIASAHQSHNFSISHNGTLENSRWVYSLTLADGSDMVIKTETSSPNFVIPAVDDTSLYGRDINGDIKGSVVFTGLLDGVEVCDAFNLYLETKPIITNVEIVSKTPSADGLYYDLLFNVTYRGAESVNFEVEQDLIMSYLDRYRVDEPFIAHCKVSHLISHLTTWIKITVRNNHGEAVHRMEILPIATQQGAHSARAETNLRDISDTEIEIYSIDGVKRGAISSRNELTRFPQGLYLLKYIDCNNVTITEKIGIK